MLERRGAVHSLYCWGAVYTVLDSLIYRILIETYVQSTLYMTAGYPIP
jgi:hypothetical protein